MEEIEEADLEEEVEMEEVDSEDDQEMEDHALVVDQEMELLGILIDFPNQQDLREELDDIKIKEALN